MSSVKYELGFYIPEDGIIHSYRREKLKSDITFNCIAYSMHLMHAAALARRTSARCELSFQILTSPPQSL
jgi:hypothetical protein